MTSLPSFILHFSFLVMATFSTSAFKCNWSPSPAISSFQSNSLSTRYQRSPSSLFLSAQPGGVEKKEEIDTDEAEDIATSSMFSPTSTASSQVPVPPATNDSSLGATATSGVNIDWFTVVLIAYVIFAISDSIFHFVPNDQSYVGMLKGVFAGGTDAASN